TLPEKNFSNSDDQSITWFDGKKLVWRAVTVADTLFLTPDTTMPNSPQIVWLTAWIHVERFSTMKLHLTSSQLLNAWLDAESVGTITTAADTTVGAEIAPGVIEFEAALEVGVHQLRIKTVCEGSLKSQWWIKGMLEVPSKFASTGITVNLNKQGFFRTTDLLDGPKLKSSIISADGKLAAIALSCATPDAKTETWLEIRRTDTAELVRKFDGSLQLSNITWAPAGHRFSYVQRDGEISRLWLVDLDSGETRRLLQQKHSIGTLVWAPDGSFIIFAQTEKPKPDERHVQLLQSRMDRWSHWRNKSYLYQLMLPDGAVRRLTAGELSTDFNGIHPDGKSLLFTRYVPDVTERPYARDDLFRLDLQTLAAEKIWQGRFLSGVQWSPDGQRLLITAGPATFGKLGNALPDSVIPNDYDGQLYLFDSEMKTGKALTLDFNPAVKSVHWNRYDDTIYFSAVDKEYQRLYAMNPRSGKIKPVELPCAVLEKFDFAADAGRMTFTGTSVNQPKAAFVFDLKTKTSQLLADPEGENLKNVRFGAVKPWSFENSRGQQIDGRFYLPPNFDPAKEYPCIVYYYGGTSPVEQDFGGRYPKELWAANGYVVYVLQPVGAYGWGQEFSAMHVNAWGINSADDIIEGTGKFLAEHTFVDPKRVGCIGASYGGFMTMYLLTRTDIFAAAVSHAGISALTSYWGCGYWGASYNAVAAANSFPWNNPELYVKQSPLFAADKITTPLLLTHGAADTNVPPGESDQLYVALKLLNRP
ncbi:S9 family peptidase, partial [bacterium]|nr:S9 family peptidase [bacterium]